MAETLAGSVLVKLRAVTNQFRADMKRAQKELKQTSKEIGDLRTAATVGFAGVAAGIGYAVKKFADFESTMTKVGAVAQATTEQQASMTASARSLAQATEYSATQVAEGMQFMAMAGNDAATTVEAMPAVLRLASVGMIDLGSASDAVTNIMSGMGVQVEYLGPVVDQLVSATTGANTNMLQLAEAFKYAGPVASMANVSFTEATAAMAMMGNAGIQGSLAGTSLRNAITRMLNPTKAAQEVMKGLGLKFTDANHQLLPLVDIIRQLEDSGADTTAMMTLFGARAVAAMGALKTQGADALAEFNTRLDESGNASDEIMRKVEKTFSYQLKILQSKFEEASISIGESLAPALTEINQAIQKVLDAFNSLSPETKALIAEFALGAVAVLGLLSALTLLAPGLAVAAGAIGALLSPFAAVIAIVGLVTYAVYELRDTWKQELAKILGITDKWVRKIEGAFTLAKDLMDGLTGGAVSAGIDLLGGVTGIGSLATGMDQISKGIDDWSESLKNGLDDIDAFGSGTGKATKTNADLKAEMERLKQEAAETTTHLGKMNEAFKGFDFETIGGAGDLFGEGELTDALFGPAQREGAIFRERLKEAAETAKAKLLKLAKEQEAAAEQSAKEMRDLSFIIKDKLKSSLSFMGDNIADAVVELGASVAGSLISAAPKLSATIEGAMKGFEATGDIWGAIIGAIIGLLSQAEFFMTIIQAIEGVLAKVLEIIDELVFPVAEAVEAVLQIVESLLDLIHALGSFEPVVRMTNAVVSVLTDSLMLFNDIIQEFVGWLTQLSDDLFYEIGKAIEGIFGRNELSGELMKGKISRNFNEAAENMMDQLALMLENQTRKATEAWEDSFDFKESNRLIDEIFKLRKENERLRENTGQTADVMSTMAEQVSDATDAITNVPEGFKVAAERFAAIQTGGLQGAGFSGYDIAAMQGAAAGMNINIESMTVADARDFLDQLEREGQWRNYVTNGTTVQQAPEPGGQ